MFSTGFCTQPEGIAESTDSETLAWMKCKAAETNAAIAGSVAVTKDGKVLIATEPGGWEAAPVKYGESLQNFSGNKSSA